MNDQETHRNPQNKKTVEYISA